MIAILPPAGVTDRVRAVQQEIADRFGPRKILKIPVHLTLEAPFRLSDEEAPGLILHLSAFFSHKNAFSTELRNFGAFRDNVIFIEVAPNLALLELHNDTSAFLREETKYIHERPWQQGYTPHITVANRDVTPRQHREIWSEFKSRKFYAKFDTPEICLLRHGATEGNVWQVHARFPLSPATDETFP